MATNLVHNELMRGVYHGVADQPGLRMDHLAGEFGLSGIKPQKINGHYPDFELGNVVVEVESGTSVDGHAFSQAVAFTSDGDLKTIFLYPEEAQVGPQDFPSGTIVVNDPDHVVRILRGDAYFESAMALGVGMGLASSVYASRQMRSRNRARRERALSIFDGRTSRKSPSLLSDAGRQS